MVIRSVDHGDVDICACERLCGRESSEPAADDHHVRMGIRVRSHRGSLPRGARRVEVD